MSAPALAPRPARPAPGRPAGGRTTRPAAGNRQPGARTGATRTGTTRTGDARNGGARTGATRTGPAQVPAARTGVARSGDVVGTRGSAATARALPQTAPEQARPRMRVVERPDLAPHRVGFLLGCTALLGVLMLGLLLLNVAISGNAFTLSELDSERVLLVESQQSLEQQLLVESAPASLAAKATRLGMGPAQQTIVLESDGTGAPPVVADE